MSSISRNYMRSDRSHLAILCATGMISIILLLFPFDAEAQYAQCYAACTMLLLIGVTCCYDISTRNPAPLDPFYVVSVIYMFMYSICPMYDIIIGKYTWYGYSVFRNGLLATAIAAIGYMAFYLVYRNVFKRPRNIHAYKSLDFTNKSIPKYFIGTIVGIWLFCFVSNAFYMVSGGNSLAYCLSLGFFGEGGGQSSAESLGFVSMFSYALPAATLLYCQYGKGRLIKVVMVYLMLVLQISRGFRFIVIQIALMLLIYYRLKNKRYPNKALVVSAAIILLGALLLMTMFRNDVRSGAGMDIAAVTGTALSDAFDDMFWENLRIYKNFYGMVGVIPKFFPFCYGDEIIVGTLVMLVPRVLWPSKPSMYGGESLVTLLGPNIASGQAYPGLGEYYYALGVVGVIVMMGIQALLMKYMSTRKGSSDDPLDWIMYATVVSCNLQLVIRGYMPSNFWLVVFSIIPIFAIRAIFGKNTVYFSGANQ